jgi:phosphate transport system substrate-binding protein
MRVLLAALCLLALSARATEIRVVGSDLLGESFGRAAAEFARQNDTVVKLNLRGTRPGVDDLQLGRADLGVFLLPSDEPAPLDRLVSRVVAYQVAVVVVPSVSPLRQMTMPQLRGLYAQTSGQTLLRWGDVNLSGSWADRPVLLRALAAKAGLAFPLFQRVVLAGGEPNALLEYLPTEAAFAQRVATTDNAIGVTGLFPAEPAGLRVLSLAASPTDPAYAPTPENVHQGGYPLRMPLYVTFPREARADLLPFLKFLLSDEGAAALTPAHFVPLPVGVRNQLVFELEEMK